MLFTSKSLSFTLQNIQVQNTFSFKSWYSCTSAPNTRSKFCEAYRNHIQKSLKKCFISSASISQKKRYKIPGGSGNLTAVCTQTTFKALFRLPLARSEMGLLSFAATVGLVERMGLS